jgi:hypothetical protein
MNDLEAGFMMEVGGRKVLMSERLFVPDGEDALVNCFIAEGDVLNMKFQFTQEAEVEIDGETRSPDARFDVDYVTDGDNRHIDQLVVRFFNFNKAFGQTFKAPVPLADSNNKESIFLFASVHKLGSISKIEFQVMLGEAV